MSETEKLLAEAQDVALRSFEDPSQETVMALFHALLAERDRRAWETPDAVGATVH